jgi:UDP-N-acetyl-D-galactosamine dehydrogenase
MGEHVANRVVRLMTRKRINVVDARVLILGLAFKENCPDLRNTRVVDIIKELKLCNAEIDVYDPWVDREHAQTEFGFRTIEAPGPASYDAVIIAVAHDCFRDMGIDAVRALTKSSAVIFDIKYLFPADTVDARL